MMISNAPVYTTMESVLEIFTSLNFGIIDKVDVVFVEGRNCNKVFVHYSTWDTGECAQSFKQRLLDNAHIQEGGGNITPAKIIYGSNRDGSDRYWQVYHCKTPQERVNAYMGNKGAFKARVEF